MLCTLYRYCRIFFFLCRILKQRFGVHTQLNEHEHLILEAVEGIEEKDKDRREGKGHAVVRGMYLHAALAIDYQQIDNRQIDNLQICNFYFIIPY